MNSRGKMNTFANDAPSYFLIFVARFVFLNNSENCCKPIEFYMFNRLNETGYSSL